MCNPTCSPSCCVRPMTDLLHLSISLVLGWVMAAGRGRGPSSHGHTIIRANIAPISTSFFSFSSSASSQSPIPGFLFFPLSSLCLFLFVQSWSLPFILLILVSNTQSPKPSTIITKTSKLPVSFRDEIIYLFLFFIAIFLHYTPTLITVYLEFTCSPNCTPKHQLQTPASAST